MSGDLVGALTKSVHDLDASRRVGWAKAFDAQASADEAHRIAAITSGDRDAYRGAASYLWGVLRGLTSGAFTGDLMDSLIEPSGDVVHLLDEAVVRSGHRKGMRLAKSAITPEVKAARDALKVESKRASRALDAQFARGRRNAVAQLCQDYGFTEVEQLHAVLAKWQAASGAKPHRQRMKFGRLMVGRSSEVRLRAGDDPADRLHEDAP